MFATLPDFTPRDSHSLWYTSSRNPLSSPPAVDSVHVDPNGSGNSHHGANQQRQRSHIIEKTALARLAAEEQWARRRRMNVRNFGSQWIRPPGVSKTLHQTREEKRELEDHQEALRREQLAQQLAEVEGRMRADGLLDDVQLDGAQDLDDEIPDADDDFAMGDETEEEEGEEEEEEEEEEEDPDETEDDDGEEEDGEDHDGEDEDEDEGGEEASREERRDLMAARMRMSDDAFREAMVRGDPEGDDLYGGEEELEDGEREHMLDEEDFADGTLDDGMAGDMGANLDDDIPEAEDGGYEHTDSEADLSSGSERAQENEDEGDDDDGIHDISFAPRAAPLGPPQSPTLRGRLSLPRYRASIDLSGLLSQDESSFMDSSPAQGRRARRQ